jgi:hypothetical protein
MIQAPGLCFGGALDALPQYFFAGVKHDVEDVQPAVVQAGEYLLQVSADQDRLGSDEVLAGETGQFGGGRHHERTPRRPVLEIGHTFVTTMLDAGVDLRDVQIAARHADPRTSMRQSGPARTSTVTPTTSSLPTRLPAPEIRAGAGYSSGCI